MNLKYSPGDFSLRLKLFQPQHLPCHFSPVQPHPPTIYPLHTKSHVVLRIHSSLPSLAQPTSSEKNTLSSFLAWEPSLYLLRLGPSIILWDDYPDELYWIAAPRIFCNHLARFPSTMAFIHLHHVKFNKWTFKCWISKIKDTSHALYLPTVQWRGKLNSYHTVTSNVGLFNEDSTLFSHPAQLPHTAFFIPMLSFKNLFSLFLWGLPNALWSHPHFEQDDPGST